MSETDQSLACAECGRKPRPDENAADQWRAYPDIDDDLPVFCPECAKREFGRSSCPLEVAVRPQQEAGAGELGCTSVMQKSS